LGRGRGRETDTKTDTYSKCRGIRIGSRTEIRIESRNNVRNIGRSRKIRC
jgi:hypothetical protein